MNLRNPNPSQARPAITAIAKHGHWKGIVNGVTFKIDRTPQPNFDGHQITYTASYHRHRDVGEALTVLEALENGITQLRKETR